MKMHYSHDTYMKNIFSENKIKTAAVCLLALVLMFILSACASKEERALACIYTEIDAEAGAEFSSEDFLYKDADIEFTGEFLADYVSEGTASVSSPGDYIIELIVNRTTVSALLVVRDTTAPVAVITPQTVYFGNDIPKADAFVCSISDAGPVTVSYKEEPSGHMSPGGIENVQIVLTDQSGNTTVLDSCLYFASDEEAPVILSSPENLKIKAGNPIYWRSQTEAVDNSGSVELYLDTSQADTETPGCYDVYIVAEDEAGNTARQKVILEVEEYVITQEMMDEVCEKIVSSIITEGMSVQEKLKAVWQYVESHVGYINDSPHDSELRQGYLALTSRPYGDCYAQYAASYELLTYMGFDVVTVRRSLDIAQAGRGNHFWCLVNCGTAENPQWYHHDACLRGTNAVESYMMTGSQVWAYTKYMDVKCPSWHDYYTYDRSLYPSASETPVYDIGIDAVWYENYDAFTGTGQQRSFCR